MELLLIFSTYNYHCWKIFSIFLSFQRFLKIITFCISLRFSEKLRRNFFFDKCPPKIDVRHQFYMIKRDISILSSMKDSSEMLKECVFSVFFKNFLHFGNYFYNKLSIHTYLCSFTVGFHRLYPS